MGKSTDSMLDRETVNEHFCFEDGVVECVDRVQALLFDQDLVVVGIDGSDICVGKSTLLTVLSHRFDSLRIPVTTCSEIGGIPENIFNLEHKRTVYQTPKQVILVEHVGAQMYVTPEVKRKVVQDRKRQLNVVLRYYGYDNHDIDVIVSIYAPHKPFALSDRPGMIPLGDVVICNEKAKDR